MNIARKFYLIHKVKKSSRKRYVCNTAKNAAINILRKESNVLSFEESFEEHIIDEAQLMEEAVINTDNCEQLLKKLNKINASHGEVIYLRYYEELSFKEIAEYLNIKPATAKVRAGRAFVYGRIKVH